jgi:hypothetical protein
MDNYLQSRRQEAATVDPTSLATETIIENMAPAEAARLSKVRNIGIAVRLLNPIRKTLSETSHRHILTVARPLLPSEYCSIQDE